jgi:hypothetical protein
MPHPGSPQYAVQENGGKKSFRFEEHMQKLSSIQQWLTNGDNCDNG